MSSQLSDAPAPRQLGRYHLLDEIGRDALGILHLARLEGPQGFQRWATVRRIHPRLADDANLVRAFYEAVRVAARIQHPNVATTFDVGEPGGPPWVAREYLHGEPLSDLVARAASTKTMVPWDIACRLIADAAQGADTIRDLTTDASSPMGFLYGHVSPRDMLVTYDGKTKIADGCLPELATTPPRGDPALPYSAPEAARAVASDRRRDVFALGVALWELCAGKRLYAGVDDAETRALLEAGVVPALRNSGQCPGAVDEIVRRALAKEPEARFPSGRALARDLQACLVAKGLVVSDDDVGRYMLGVFADKFEVREAFLHSAANVTEIFDRSAVNKELGDGAASKSAPEPAAPPKPPAAPPPPDTERTLPRAADSDADPTQAMEREPMFVPDSRRVPHKRVAHRGFEEITTVPKDDPTVPRDDTTVPHPITRRPPAAQAPPQAPLPQTTLALPRPPRVEKPPVAVQHTVKMTRPVDAPTEKRPRVRSSSPSLAAVEGRDPWIIPVLAVLAVILATFGGIYVFKRSMRATEATASAEEEAEDDGAGSAEPAVPGSAIPAVAATVSATATNATTTTPTPTATSTPTPTPTATATPTTAPGHPTRRPPPPPPRPPPPATGHTGLLTVFCSPACDDVLDGSRSLGPSPVFKVTVAAGSHHITLRTTSPAIEKTLNVNVAEDETTVVRQAME